MRNIGNHVVTVRLDVKPGQTTGDAAIDRIAELEAAVRASLNMVDGNGTPPDWDWMRAVLADKSADYFLAKHRTK